MSASLVLASASPRRTALLNQLGIEHQIYPVDIDESAKPEVTPEAQVARLAYEKASTALARLASSQTLTQSTVVLASDTLIAFAGKSVGKPKNLEDSRRILSMLSGQQHSVLTAICVANESRQVTQTITTKVTFGMRMADRMSDIASDLGKNNY